MNDERERLSAPFHHFKCNKKFLVFVGCLVTSVNC